MSRSSESSLLLSCHSLLLRHDLISLKLLNLLLLDHLLLLQLSNDLWIWRDHLGAVEDGCGRELRRGPELLSRLNELRDVRLKLIDIFVSEQCDTVSGISVISAVQTRLQRGNSLDIVIINDQSITVFHHTHPNAQSSSSIHVISPDLVQPPSLCIRVSISIHIVLFHLIDRLWSNARELRTRGVREEPGRHIPCIGRHRTAVRIPHRHTPIETQDTSTSSP